MVRVTNRLWFRLTSVVLVIHAVLLPLLFFGLLLIVQHSHADIFVDQVRTYGRLLADELELGDALTTPERTVALLDSIILSGQGMFAEVQAGNEPPLRSTLVAPEFGKYPGDNFEFGDRGDRTYFFSVPIPRKDGQVILRLGFDESAVWDQIHDARNRILLALIVFTVVSVGLAIWLATRIAQPMIRLQNAARSIATGHFDAHLEAGSGIQEVQQLTQHLESMRSELVGINERLSLEIMERAAAEAQRRSLEERLRHSERIATVGTLAGGIAHEFNNIMTPILLYAQAALDDVPETSAPADDLHRVIAAAHRARTLVNRVLTFSRDIQSGPTVPVNVAAVVEEVVALLRAIAPPNIEIVSRIGSPLATIPGDASLVHQLVMNLCTNASQAMRASGGRMTVTLAQRSERSDERVPTGEYVVLEVADTGHGMDAKTLSRIFEPFFTTRDVGEGTGLGLSVVHGIASSMGAVVVADSQPGRGATFRVYFAMAARAETGADLATDSIERPAGEAAQ
ncbi:MAG TPA: ATP-binding protein [Steroidobacteraceae bacterium]|jgi:signal transduction histidine kinase